MSNRVTIQPTIFRNHPNGEETYGFRAYDDYAQIYNNTWESIPDDDLEILALAIGTCAASDFVEMIDYLIDAEKGINIGSASYSWEEIRPILCGAETK